MSNRLRNLENAVEQAIMAFGQVVGMAPICLIKGPDKGKVGYYREGDATTFMLKERGGGAYVYGNENGFKETSGSCD